MQGIKPQGLTTEELLNAVHAMNFNAPVSYVQELCDRLYDLMNAVENNNAPDPRQLELPL